MRNVFVFSLVLGVFSQAALGDVGVGSKAVVVSAVELKTNGGSKLMLTPGTVVDVRQVNGPNLTVGSPRIGDVPAAVVIPLADAEKRFDQWIAEKPQDPVAWTARGKLWFHHLKQEKAIADFDESLKLRPDAETMTLRAFAWKRLGNKEKAMSLLDETIKFDPQNALAWRVRGATWASLGEYAKTLAHYTESIRIDPENPESLLHRAILQSGCEEANVRNGKQAVEDAVKACDLAGYDVPLYLNCLSFAYSEVGDFDSAIKWQQKIIELSAGKQNKGAEDRIAQYRQKKPYRTSWKR